MGEKICISIATERNHRKGQFGGETGGQPSSRRNNKNGTPELSHMAFASLLRL
jgi:hypothetical protein